MTAARRTAAALAAAAALAVAAVALGTAAGCRADATPGDTAPEDELWLSPAHLQRAGVRVTEATTVPLADAITASGRVAFDDMHVSHVFSPVTGRVTRVLARPGQRVTRGAPLVALRSPDVGTALADALKARADLQASERDFHREARLLGQDATSQRSYEAAEDAYRRTRAEDDRARQRAAVLRAGGVDAVTQDYELRSPVDGEVIARNVNPGIEVAGQYSGGTAVELFTIGDIQQVWVYADLGDTDLPAVHVGDPVEVRVVAYPGRVFRGAIDLVAATVDPALRTGRVRCSLANPGGELKPEMFATLAIAQPPRTQLAVPHDAVVAINESSYVYVEAGARPDGSRVFKRRPVAIGTERDGAIPIRDGLAAGDRVLVEAALPGDPGNDAVGPTPRQLAAADITTARVEARDLTDAITVGGRVAFDDGRIGHVFSPVNGRITRVLAQPGQRVAKGAALVAITSPDLGNAMADAIKAEADHTQAEHEYQRQNELGEAGVGARRDLEAAEDGLRRAAAELARARQLAELLRGGDYDAVSQEYILRSPIAGEVIARRANPGLEVQGQYASSSNVIELFTIGELDELWLLGDAYEIDLPRVHAGDAVTVHADAYPGRVLHGRIDWVSDVLDPSQHTAKLRCILDNRDHLLKPEMYERLDISVPVSRALVVPRASVLRVDGQSLVFVKTARTRPDGGVVFQRRKVTARLGSDAALVEVSSGLAAGEIVAADHAVMLLGML